MNDVEVIAGYSLDDARQFALNRLVDIVRHGTEFNAIHAAGVLLSDDLGAIDFPISSIVDEGDAPYVPCDCPICRDEVGFDEEVRTPDPDPPVVWPNRFTVFFTE